MAGLIAGFAVWFLLLFLPSLSSTFPFLVGLSTHRLLYIDGLDMWSNCIFWSLFFNLFFTISISILTSQSAMEQEISEKFVKSYEAIEHLPEKEYITGLPSYNEYLDFLSKFVGKENAEKALKNFYISHNLNIDEPLKSHQSILLKNHLEKTLSAYLGGPTAKSIIESFLKVHGTKIVEIFNIFKDISESLKESKETLALRVKELTLLYSSLQRLMSTIDEEEILDIAIQILGENFGAPACAIVLLDRDGKLRIKRQKGLDEALAGTLTFDSSQTSYVGKVFAEKVVITIEDIEQAPFPPRISTLKDGSPIQSLAIAPIIVTGSPLGVIFLLNNKKQFFSEHFINFFQGIANQIGLSLKNAQLYAQLSALNKELETKVAERTIELRNKSQLLEEAYNNLKEVDRLKTQFLSTMSHELRTPLNSIIGYTQLLLDEVDGEITGPQREDLERIEKNAKHLLQLINDILDLSKIEAGKMQLNITKIDLKEAVNQAISIVLPLIGNKPLKIINNIGEKSIYILADFQRLEQIIINLLSNAIKFTDEGTVTIDCQTSTDSTNQGWVTIWVQDTGIGITPENLDKIFEPFKQIEQTSTRKHGGTGLGLSITKKLVELHGGALWVKSEWGKGSTFYFTMPLATSDFTKPFIKEVKLIERERTKNIFVIDNKEMNLQFIYDSFAQDGFSVEFIDKSNIFFKSAEKRPFAILINRSIYENDEQMRTIISDDLFSKTLIFTYSDEGLKDDILNILGELKGAVKQ